MKVGRRLSSVYIVLPTDSYLTLKQREIIMPTKKNYYWTKEVDEGIKLYQNTSEQSERNIIYKKYLEKPFKRMSEIIVRMWRFQYLQEDIISIVNQCESFMVMKIPNFNVEKGNSFSYYTVVLRNHLIQLNNSNYEKLKTISMIQPDSPYLGGRKIKRETRSKYTNSEENEILSLSMDSFTSFLKRNGERLLKGKYKRIIPTLIDVIDDRENTYHYHKKSLLELFRSKTELNSIEIRQGLKKMVHLFKNIHIQIRYKGEIDKVWEKQIMTF